MRRGRADKDEVDIKGFSVVHKDSVYVFFCFFLGLALFTLGVIIGLVSSSHIDRYFTFQAGDFSSNRAPSPATDFSRNYTVVEICEQEICEDCLNMQNFIRPKKLTHRMSDEELFWRATMVPQKPTYPYHRKPKVAFMFLTKGRLPMLPFWERFFQGQNQDLYSIYVHAPPGYLINITSLSVFFGRQIPSKKVEWGSISLADSEKRLLANALLDFSNERFVLLSESCIPVYNFPTVYKYLTESVHSFVESYDDPTRYGRGRYSRHMLPDIKLSDWRKGSQWFELNRSLAIKIVSDTKYYTLFDRYCKPSCYPDEHYIPTFLHMFYGPLNSNRTVTWTDWTYGGPHPRTFESINISEGFLQSIRKNGTLCSYNDKKTSMCYLFARKFGPSALEPLMNLAAKVMEF